MILFSWSTGIAIRPSVVNIKYTLSWTRAADDFYISQRKNGHCDDELNRLSTYLVGVYVKDVLLVIKLSSAQNFVKV